MWDTGLRIVKMACVLIVHFSCQLYVNRRTVIDTKE